MDNSLVSLPSAAFSSVSPTRRGAMKVADPAAPSEGGPDMLNVVTPRSPHTIFGFSPSELSFDAVVELILSHSLRPEDGIQLVVTPNIDHVAQLRQNEAFRAAYAGARLILCDGFPIHYWAVLNGIHAHHITGCDLTTALMRSPDLAKGHRLVFLVDSQATADIVKSWATGRGIGGTTGTLVPPFGFVDDEAWCRQAIETIQDFAPTLLFMAVGAPQSEIFINRYRDSLPACWAMCVGQGVKIELGVIRRAPLVMRVLHAEWLWRVMQEPRRLAPRYAAASKAFLKSIVEEWRPQHRRD